MYNQLDIEEQSSLKKLSLPTNACQQNEGKIKRNKQQSLKKTCPPITSKKIYSFLISLQESSIPQDSGSISIFYVQQWRKE